MQLTLSFAATAGLAALAACSANQDNTTANMDSGAGESVLPVEDNGVGTGPIDNQAGELDESGNAAESAIPADGTSENTANSY
jgi:hypothetical protein